MSETELVRYEVRRGHGGFSYQYQTFASLREARLKMSSILDHPLPPGDEVRLVELTVLAGRTILFVRK